MATAQSITTAEQLLHAPNSGRCELVRGELIMMNPAGFEHGRLVSRINARIELFVDQNKLGIVTGAETGFLIERDPDTVRAPDVGFVRAERVPLEPVRGFFPGAPDLAVEVLSPDDRVGEVLVKVQQWIAAGCLSVWVVDPKSKMVSAYSSDTSATVFAISDVLTDETVLPNFKLALEEIFRR